ncbi:WD40/YVTN/BNR-like repeat-containing protein [Dongia deserti]|uniref:WD40/YVTN/BNR-like repeat-containing protein n=1 Tax=Dongia deserti TaxID=2268030 RepID=UPI0025494A2F|nr:hypothetical protein [Dongia deserti]
MKRSFSAAAALAYAIISFAMPATAADSVPLSKLETQTHYHGLAVDPTDPSRLYLATHHGFYLVAADGTATRLSQVQDFMGFTPHPTDPSVLYASGHPSNGGNLGFLMSVDGGANWTQISPGLNGPVDFHQMDVSPADPQVIYGVYGGIQVSRDGGKTWSMAGPAPEGLIALAASARSADRLYGATQNGLVISDDAGATWQAVAFGGETVSMVATGPDDMLYAYAVGQGLMSAKEEKPNEWSPLSSDERIQLHLAIDARDPNRMFAIAHKAGIIQSTDGGKSWQSFGQP